MNSTLAKLKSNLQAADDAMRRYPAGGTPNRLWVGEQLMLVRILEEAGTIDGEWDGLFVGLLDTIMTLNRHRERQIQAMTEHVAHESYEDFLKRVDAFSSTNRHIDEKSSEFIRKFGDRLTLKAQS